MAATVEDALVIHYSDDCYHHDDKVQFYEAKSVNGETKYHEVKGVRTPRNNPKKRCQSSPTSTIPELQLIAVFERLHHYDKKLISDVHALKYGVVKKYGRRPIDACMQRPTGLVRSSVVVPSGLKGHTHCSQRVFAAMLHLQWNVPVDSLDLLFQLKPLQQLGEDTDAREVNRTFRSPDVIDWLAFYVTRSIPELMKPVVGDYSVRELLRNLAPNEACFVFPVDYRGVGRHCSLAYRPRVGGKVVLWDPSPTFDIQDECPLWVRYNETCINVRSYAEARMVSWNAFLPLVQSSANKRRAKKRKRISLNSQTS